MPNPHFSQAHESSLLTQWRLSVTIHLGALSNLDAETHIETTAGQLIRQPEDSGQRKTVKISYSQIFSSSIERGRQKFRDFERVFSSMFDIKWSMWSALDGDTDCRTQAYNCPIFLHLYYFMYSTQGGNLGPPFKKMRQYGSF